MLLFRKLFRIAALGILLANSAGCKSKHRLLEGTWKLDTAYAVDYEHSINRKTAERTTRGQGSEGLQIGKESWELINSAGGSADRCTYSLKKESIQVGNCQQSYNNRDYTLEEVGDDVLKIKRVVIDNARNTRTEVTWTYKH